MTKKVVETTDDKSRTANAINQCFSVFLLEWNPLECLDWLQNLMQ